MLWERRIVHGSEVPIFMLRETILDERVAEGSFFLKGDGESLFLQLSFTPTTFKLKPRSSLAQCVSYCDFVVWTNESSSVYTASLS